MRKNLNKIVAFAIGISVVSGSFMPVFAADNAVQIDTMINSLYSKNQKLLLTLDDAIKGAVSASETIQMDTKKITYQDNVNDVNEDLDDYNNVSGDEEDFNEDTRDVTVDKLRQKRDFDEDILVQKVTKAYNEIVTSQLRIEKAAKELEINNKELSDAKFKESLGMITPTNLKSTELEIEDLQIAKRTSENSLKDAEYSFKVLTNKDVTKYRLNKDIPNETLKIDKSVDTYFDNVIDKYLKYSEELLKIQKEYYKDSDKKVTDADVSDAKEITEGAVEPKLSDYEGNIDEYEAAYSKYEKDKSAYTNVVSQRLTYLANKLSVDESQITLNENKKEFKNQLKALYTNLLTSEENINHLKKNIELNNKKLSDTKLKYDLGMITQSSYNTQVINSEDLDLQLRETIETYNTLKEKIQKPWIAFSNS